MANQKTYHIEWKLDALIILDKDSINTNLILEKLGNLAFSQTRGDDYMPGLYEIDFPQITEGNYAGIDIPCLIYSETKSSETIMIIGEAPWREKNYIEKDKCCSLGAPYAIGFIDYPDRCWIYKQIIKRLVDTGYNIYLTDAYKLWTKKKIAKESEYRATYKEMLINEIRSERPCKVITFGKVAKAMVQQVAKNLKDANIISKIEIFNILHPSQRVTCLWEKVLKGKKYPCDVPNYVVDFVTNKKDSNDMYDIINNKKR